MRTIRRAKILTAIALASAIGLQYGIRLASAQNQGISPPPGMPERSPIPQDPGSSAPKPSSPGDQGLPTPFTAAQVQQLIKTPVPDVRAIPIRSSTPQHRRRFLGIWIGEFFAGVGPIASTIIIYNVNTGEEKGIYSWGPVPGSGREGYVLARRMSFDDRSVMMELTLPALGREARTILTVTGNNRANVEWHERGVTHIGNFRRIAP
jgi:hypothetical protein